MKYITLTPIHSAAEKAIFISEIQEAFQKAYEAEYGALEQTILPTEDIEESFAATGAEAYFAELDGTRVGGTIIVPNEKPDVHTLHLLYVKPGAQNAGNGFQIWNAIEKLHPEARIWETHTPYYDKRNIHFYVNRCGFHIVEFFHAGHPDPHQAGESAGNILPEQNFFFRFEKKMR